ncbi:hypothetical protein E2C01_046910 [Portunus trituberculatus]|uniref:Uncharacterized protein n=1 Tax=Portunus trituberculatus TaxID=210409 RepID=A0A5B7G6B9_PORTR|nr:hypothetical protein [Portunus trituberculatus]
MPSEIYLCPLRSECLRATTMFLKRTQEGTAPKGDHQKDPGAPRVVDHKADTAIRAARTRQLSKLRSEKWTSVAINTLVSSSGF